MRILVCMKPAVDTETAVMKDSFLIDRERSSVSLNPSDCAALEQALTLKERQGGEITVVTMGGGEALSLLRQVSPFDVDRLIHISDRKYAGSDTLATAKILARAAEKLGAFDLILMGRRSIDGETGHVGPETAALLGIPCITNVTGLWVEGTCVRCERLLERKCIKAETMLPAIVTVCGGANRLRPVSLLGMRRAKNAEIKTVSNDVLSMEENEIGLEGSPTRIKDLITPEFTKKKTVFYDTPEEGAKAILRAVSANHEKKNETGAIDGRRRCSGLHGVFVHEYDEESFLAGRALLHHAKNSGCRTVCILVGQGGVEVIKKLAEAGAEETHVLQMEDDGDDCFIAGKVSELMKGLPLESLVFAATIRGRAIAPACAGICGLGITADCTSVEYKEDGTLVQCRPTFGGTKLAKILSRTRPQLATIRPGVYPLPPQETVSESDGGTVRFFGPTKRGRVKVLAEEMLFAQNVCDAKGIVAGGKSVGREGFRLLSEIAEGLGYSIGGSRAAVDGGMVAYSSQIGQTGSVVRPEVYIAFGISGAVQHIVGMKDSLFVIAVNTDRQARIFDYADIGIRCGFRETAEALLKLMGLERRYGI